MRGHENFFRAEFRPIWLAQVRLEGSSTPSSPCFASSVVGHSHAVPVNIHRYEEHIAGRTYHIEVRFVSDTRWRAQIARLPGMPTSLMPFYGATPEQAAHELSRWLAMVYNGTTIKQ